MSHYLAPILSFLAELKENNHREWFEANRSRYAAIREEWIAFLAGCQEKIIVFDADIADMQPKDAVFRINRDVRFSKNKAPYKTHFGAYFAKGGRQSDWAGYYIHIEPQQCFVGGGAYMPPPNLLKQIRQEIDYNSEDFLAIINNPQFKNTFGELQGESLKTMPKDYPKDHPLANYLKLKGFFVTHPLEEDLTAVALQNEIVKAAQLLYPLNNFFNKAMEIG